MCRALLAQLAGNRITIETGSFSSTVIFEKKSKKRRSERFHKEVDIFTIRINQMFFCFYHFLKDVLLDAAFQVALGQDAMEVVHRQLQAFLPGQQKVQEEAQKAQLPGKLEVCYCTCLDVNAGDSQHWLYHILYII